MINDSTPSGPFTWGDITISQNVFINNVPHATKRAIGEWLEYAYPKEAINKILERNQYIDEFSTEVNMTSVDGKNRDTRVYHPMGFLLIAMESNQPRAKMMKRAIAHFVWHFSKPKPINRKDEIALRNQRINILAKLEKSTKTFVQQSLLNDLGEVSHTLGTPVPAISWKPTPMGYQMDLSEV